MKGLLFTRSLRLDRPTVPGEAYRYQIGVFLNINSVPFALQLCAALRVNIHEALDSVNWCFRHCAKRPPSAKSEADTPFRGLAFVPDPSSSRVRETDGPVDEACSRGSFAKRDDFEDTLTIRPAGEE